MKRLLLFFSALLMGISGMWATETTIALATSAQIKANGTFYDSSDNVVNSTAWCAKVVVGSVTLTGSVSNYSGYIDAKRNATLTISVPAGMTISSFSMGVRLTGSGTAAKVGDVALSNSTIKTAAASSVNAQSTSITFSDITGDSNNECLIEITDFILTIDNYSGSSNTVVNSTFTREINGANGKFYSGDSEKTWSYGDNLFGNKWVSTSTSPKLTMYCGNSEGGGSNNIIINSGYSIHADTYTLKVSSDRYRITGYVITGYAASGKSYSITPNGQTKRIISESSDKPTAIYVDGLYTTSTSFKVEATAGASPWFLITSFRVAVEDLVTKTNSVLDELANISVYSSVTSTKTTIASATTQADIETAVNNAVNINVAFGNCNTSNPVKYLATTGANITGSDFSTDAAWKLTGYNAEDGTFKLYNSAHETYLGPLPSAVQTAATATTNAASAGSYYIVATTAGAAGGAGKAIFKRLDFEDYREALHYQTSGSIAVRWDDDAKASQWDAVNVYSLTYNHYKVADAANPSTSGATLFATSTNYYISGTNITYDAPIAGLSPVTSLNSQPSDGAISSDVVVDYYYEQDATLPFTTSTISNGELDNPTWYYMQINGLATYASGDKMVVDGSRTGLHYERWCFVGDAINGVQIFAESKGVVYPLNIASMAKNDNVQLTSTSTNTRWFVSGSDLSSLTFYQKSGDDTWALSQLGGLDYGSGWSWKVGLWSSGSSVELSPTSSNMPDDWAIEAVNTIPTGDEWNNAGTIGWPSLTARSALQTALLTFGMGTTYANYSALLTARENYLSAKGSDLTTPPAGFYKFYHKTTSTGNKKYVYADGTTAKSSITNGTDVQKIWYFNGNSASLVAYSNGYQFDNMATLSTTGKNMTISGHTTHTTFPMPYNIIPSDASAWYISNNDTDYDLNRASIIEGSNFYIEKVTSLPVTLTDLSSYGIEGCYATFYTPVKVEIDGATAYTLSLTDGGTLRATEVENNIVPAGTGVILVGDNTSATATITSDEAQSEKGGLSGSCVAMNSPENSYIFTALTDDGGSTYTLGFFKNGFDVIPGFKAYYQSEQGLSTVRGFSISFDLNDAIADVISTLTPKSVYDLQGRRVNMSAKGLYIINGKKVIK